jgi:glutamate synthase (NADPH/NADH) large chain
MVELEALESAEDVDLVLSLIRRHVELTSSALGERVLADWDRSMQQFVKIMPRDYQRVLTAQARAAAAGRDASFLELVGVSVNG